MAILTRNVIDSRINCCNSAGQFTLLLYQCIADEPSAPQSYTLLNNEHIKLSINGGMLTLDDTISLPAGWLSRVVKPYNLPKLLLINRAAVPSIEISFIGTDDPRPCADPPIHRILINGDGIFLAIQEEKLMVYIPPSALAQEAIVYSFSHPCF